MPDPEPTQPSVTGEPAAEPGAQTRIRELVEERRAVEARLAASEAARIAEAQRLQKLIEERIPAPKEPEPEWTDPAEAALKEAREARAEMNAWKAQERERAAQAQANYEIQTAVASRWGTDPEMAREASEEMALRYYAEKQLGRQFNAEEAAKGVAEKFKRLGKDPAAAAARIEEQRKRAEATASAVGGGASTPTGLPQGLSETPPKWGTPERAAWEADMSKAILRKHGFAAP